MSPIQPAGFDESRAESLDLVLVRCPEYGGLRAISARQGRRAQGTRCRECFQGRCVPVSAFFEFWTVRISGEEIEAMARAIWG